MDHTPESPRRAPRRVVVVTVSGPIAADRALELLERLDPLDAVVLVAVRGVCATRFAPVLDTAGADWAVHDQEVTQQIWVCPTGSHLEIRDGRFVLTPAGDDGPSLDKLLYNARSEFRSRVTAIVGGDDVLDSPCLRLVELRGGTTMTLPAADDPAAEQRLDEIATRLTASHGSTREVLSA